MSLSTYQINQLTLSEVLLTLADSTETLRSNHTLHSNPPYPSIDPIYPITTILCYWILVSVILGTSDPVLH